MTSLRAVFGAPARRAALGIMLGIAAIAIAPPHSADAASGSVLSTETFQGSSVPDSRWNGLGDACLTAAAAGSAAPAGASNLGGCTKVQDSPTNLGSGSDGYLQLTDNSGSSTGAAVLDRAFPATAGMVMTFDEYQYAKSGQGLGPADGIGFFLIDGSYTLTKAGPQGESEGGALGYASISDSSNQAQSGLDHGYLGVGMDVYGNYSSQPYVGTSCDGATTSRTPNQVVLRGPGNGTDGYCMLGKSAYSALQNAPATAPGGQQGTEQRVTVTISPTTAEDQYPTVTVAINGAQVLNAKMTSPAPKTLKLGFAASTGGGHEVHLVRNIGVTTVNPLGGIDLEKTVDHTDSTGTAKTIFATGDRVPYSFLVTNTGEEPLSGIAVTDPKISDISCPATTLAAHDSFTCTGTYGPLTASEAAAGHFDNTASVVGTGTGGNTYTDTSSATIPTYTTGSVSVRKDVTGTGAALVDSSAAFMVGYSYPAGAYQPASTDSAGNANTYPAGSGTLTVTNGGTTTTDAPIPTGAVVTFNEQAAHGVDGGTWEAPKFSANPVTVGSATTDVTLTNTIDATTGSVQWTKTDKSSGEALAGSEWTVVGPDGFSEAVVDNGANDTDATEGALDVAGLPWGEYNLTETKAPAAHTLDATPHPFTIDANTAAINLGAITNVATPTVVPPNPPTGGHTNPPVSGSTVPPTATSTNSPGAASGGAGDNQPPGAAGALINTGGSAEKPAPVWLWGGLVGVGAGLIVCVVLIRRKRSTAGGSAD